MKNIHLRLFIALTKLMTAEKMKLDQFCQPGEYLAYSIKIPPIKNFDMVISGEMNTVPFDFRCDLEKTTYCFDEKSIVGVENSNVSFEVFETHLSEFLNALFNRKVEFEKNSEITKSLLNKLVSLSQEEKECLATHVNVNADKILEVLGVKVD